MRGPWVLQVISIIQKQRINNAIIFPLLPLEGYKGEMGDPGYDGKPGLPGKLKSTAQYDLT